MKPVTKVPVLRNKKSTKTVQTETPVIESTEKQKRIRDEKNPRLLKIIKDPKFTFKGLKIGDRVKAQTFSMNKFIGNGFLVGQIVEFHTFPNKHENATAVKLKDENGNICYRVVSRLVKDESIVKTISFEKPAEPITEKPVKTKKVSVKTETKED